MRGYTSCNIHPQDRSMHDVVLVTQVCRMSLYMDAINSTKADYLRCRVPDARMSGVSRQYRWQSELRRMETRLSFTQMIIDRV